MTVEEAAALLRESGASDVFARAIDEELVRHLEDEAS